MIHRSVHLKIGGHYGSSESQAKIDGFTGRLLKHGVGHFPNGTEIDVPLTYADYYFVEAMVRYEGMFG